MKIDPNDKAALDAAVKKSDNSSSSAKSASAKSEKKSLFDLNGFKTKLQSLFSGTKEKPQEDVKTEKRPGTKERPQGLKINAKVLKTVLIGFIAFTVIAMLYGIFKERSFSVGGNGGGEDRIMTSVSPIKVGQNDRVRKSEKETVYINQGGNASSDRPSETAPNPTAPAIAAATTERGTPEVSRGNVTPTIVAEQNAALRGQPVQLVNNRQQTQLSNGNATDSLDEARRSGLYPSGFDPKSVSIAANAAENIQIGGNNPIQPETGNIVIAPYSTREMVSPYQIFQGTIIPMVLVTGICSDLPSQITARVLSDVYDSVSGQYLIIPSGSTVIGNYSSSVMWGQQRVLVMWDRLIRPDGSSVFLGSMNGVDMSGYAGYKDKVDLHIAELAGLLTVSTVMNIASGQISYQAEKQQSEKNELAGLIEGLTDSSIDATETINSMAEKFLQLQPTLTIRAGTRCNLFVNKDIVLEPYMGY